MENQRVSLRTYLARTILAAFEHLPYMYVVHVIVSLPQLPCVRAERLEKLRRVSEDLRNISPKEMVGELGIQAMVTDVRYGILGEKFDLFISNNTLEHISVDVIVEIFRAFSRLAHSQAVMSHYIDLQDHYAQYDPSINFYNFLQYPAPIWRLINNSLQYQNRLRISDYRSAHESSGWQIVFEENESGSIHDLRSVKLADQFLKYSEEDQLVCKSWMISTLTRSSGQ